MVTTVDQPETDDSRPPQLGGATRTPAPQPGPVVTAVDAPDPAGPPTPVPAATAPTPTTGAAAPPQTAPGPTTPTPTRASRPRAARTPRIRSAPRRTRVVVRKVGPLSVLKFSLLFYLCLMLIVLFAMVIVYGVLSAAGAIESLEKVLGYIFGTGRTSTGGAEPLEIDGGTVFMWGLFGGLLFVAVWSVINVFVAMLYNLISDIIGGVEVTLADKPHD